MAKQLVLLQSTLPDWLADTGCVPLAAHTNQIVSQKRLCPMAASREIFVTSRYLRDFSFFIFIKIRRVKGLLKHGLNLEYAAWLAEDMDRWPSMFNDHIIPLWGSAVMNPVGEVYVPCMFRSGHLLQVMWPNLALINMDTRRYLLVEFN